MIRFQSILQLDEETRESKQEKTIAGKPKKLYCLLSIVSEIHRFETQ